MPIFHKNRQNLQSAKNDKSQQILQDQTTEPHSIFCQNLENAVEPKTKKSAFFAAKKSTPINKKHAQKNLISTQAQTPPAPRKKFLKIFAAASLALITCATTLLATAPWQNNNLVIGAENNNTLSAKPETKDGLVIVRDDDPVVYTTSSGIEIKIGEAAGNATALPSSNLAGFPYFTTNDGTKDYTWVVIGRGTSTVYFTTAIQQFLFSTWQSNIGGLTANTGDSKGWYFLNQIYETISPAGSAINNDVPSKTCVNDLVLVKSTAEIPADSILCLLNDTVGTGVANTASAAYHDNASCNKGYNYHAYYVGQLKTTMDDIYTNATLGLSTIKDKIKSVSITTNGLAGGTSNYSVFNYSSNTVTCNIFPLSAASAFKWSNYLTATQMKLSVNQWLRDGPSTWGCTIQYSSNRCTDYSYPVKYYFNTSGENTTAYTNNSTMAYRPAFCLSLA